MTNEIKVGTDNVGFDDGFALKQTQVFTGPHIGRGTFWFEYYWHRCNTSVIGLAPANRGLSTHPHSLGETCKKSITQ